MPKLAGAIGRLLLAVVGVVLAAVTGWRLVRLYEGPWESFTEPTRAFLSAVTARDSLWLTRLGASPAVVRRAFVLGAAHPERFVIGGRPIPWTGQRIGDTTRLRYNAPPCVLVLTFVGRGSGARIVDFAIPCPTQ